MNKENTSRPEWAEEFKKYSEEGEDEKLLPDFLDQEAIRNLDAEEEKP